MPHLKYDGGHTGAFLGISSGSATPRTLLAETVPGSGRHYVHFFPSSRIDKWSCHCNSATDLISDRSSFKISGFQQSNSRLLVAETILFYSSNHSVCNI